MMQAATSMSGSSSDGATSHSPPTRRQVAVLQQLLPQLVMYLLAVAELGRPPPPLASPTHPPHPTHPCQVGAAEGVQLAAVQGHHGGGARLRQQHAVLSKVLSGAQQPHTPGAAGSGGGARGGARRDALCRRGLKCVGGCVSGHGRHCGAPGVGAYAGVHQCTVLCPSWAAGHPAAGATASHTSACCPPAAAATHHCGRPAPPRVERCPAVTSSHPGEP
jgi:hypothetical protein